MVGKVLVQMIYDWTCQSYRSLNYGSFMRTFIVLNSLIKRFKLTMHLLRSK